jgi:hypothetical protein
MTSDDEQKAIEEAFVESWNWTQKRFELISQQEWGKWTTPVLEIIQEFRNRGYDRQLRAGVMLVWLILWRIGVDDNNSLRGNVSQIVFKLQVEGSMKIQYWEKPDTREEFDVEQITLTPEIETLLTRLLAQPID